MTHSTKSEEQDTPAFGKVISAIWTSYALISLLELDDGM